MEAKRVGGAQYMGVVGGMIGKATPFIEGINKVTAESAYLEDIHLRGMLYAKILRSPLPHAKIVHIETEKAKSLPGVRSVITARDTPGIKFSFISELADKEPLCEDKVRYIGDEVAAVAAIDEYTAWEALDLIKVEYEALPAVFNPEEALGQEGPKVHEKGNIAYELHKLSGDVEKGFSEADYLFEEEYWTSKQAHCILETRGCIAHFDRTGHLTVWHQTQNPHPLREEIARALGIPAGRIRVIQPEVGGGFGGRLVMNVMVPIAAILSQRTGKPVRIVNTREEEFQCAGTRYPYRFHLKIGVMKDGKIRAKQLEVIGDNGAYNDKGPSTVNFIASSFFTSYDLHSPAKKYDARLVYTNKEPGAAFRGFGHAEERFAFESALDSIADKLGMDPAELRLKNMKRESDRVCVKTAIERSGWKEKRSQRSKKIGIGMAVLSETGGGLRYYGYNSTEAIVKIDRDGSVTLIAPAADTGTGTRTVMAQIAAQELGISLERIKILSNDTDIIPYDLGAWASRTTYVCGNAVKSASVDAKNKLLNIASKMLRESPDRLETGNDRVSVIGQPDQYVSFQEVIGEAYSKRGMPIVGKGGFYDEEATKVTLTDNYESFSPVIASSCHVAQVQVDLDTGQVEVVKYLAVHDVGKLINPLGARGQVEGGIAQGLGFALLEDLVYEQGQIINPNFIDYSVPRFMNVPKEIDCAFIEAGDSEGPYGAKGIGELPFGPVAPAIGNAIYDAVGVRITSLPITAERLLKALQAKEREI